MDDILTLSDLGNLPLTQEQVFNIIDNTNSHATEFVELADQLIIDHMNNEPTADPEAIWDRIQSTAEGLDFLYDRIDDTLAYLNTDSRVSNSTKVEINNTLNEASSVSDATVAKVNDNFNQLQISDLNTALVYVQQMNLIWTNFGGQINTAVPPFFTNDAVANLEEAAIIIQNVIDDLNVTE